MLLSQRKVRIYVCYEYSAQDPDRDLTFDWRSNIVITHNTMTPMVRRTLAPEIGLGLGSCHTSL